MDEKQINALIERIFLKLRDELKQTESENDIQKTTKSLPKAFIILPKQLQQETISRTLNCLNGCQDKYQRILVVSDTNKELDESLRRNADEIVGCDSVSLEENCVTIIVSASRNLRVRTALCLSEDFESEWVIRCIERGISVYMFKDEQEFTGKEPVSYRRKLEGYDRELRSFGVVFDSLPSGELRRAQLGSEPANTSRTIHKKSGKKVITAEDVKALGDQAYLRVESGDILTDLGKEVAQEKGIEIIYDDK